MSSTGTNNALRMTQPKKMQSLSQLAQLRLIDDSHVRGSARYGVP